MFGSNKDIVLRKKLVQLGLLDDVDCYGGYEAQHTYKSGVDKWKVAEYDKYLKRTRSLEDKLDALLELLGVTEESPETNTVLKKGNKKVVVGK